MNARLSPQVVARGLANEAVHRAAVESGLWSLRDDPTVRGALAALAVMRVYHSDAGRADYIGEQVSQLEHAAQAAHFASEEPGTPEPVVLGALLHDVGHLLPGLPQMAGDLGAVDHERAGAEFLRALGFGDVTCAVVERHVEAKRYLCRRMPNYHDSLSAASRGTLAQQGGPMTESEAKAFEADPLFSAVVRMRTWDERAKVVRPDFLVKPMYAYAEALARSAARRLARDAYERDGYVLLKRVLSAETKRRVVQWCGEVEAWPPQAGQHMLYYETVAGQETLCRTENFLPYHDGLREFLTSGELMNVLQEVMGDRPVLYKEKINYKRAGGGGFPAHQDAPAFTTFGQKMHVTVNVAVDSATVENGCLEVSPGRHKFGLFEQDPSHGGLTPAAEAGIPWVAVPLDAGDVLVFSSWIPHRSGANATGASRRALYVTYNGAGDGDYREAYYRDKAVNFPQKVERVPGKDYSEGAKRYNLATPITG